MLSRLLQNRRNVIIIGVVVLLGIIAAVVFWPSEEPIPTAENRPIRLTWWKPFYGNETYNDVIQAFRRIPGNQNVQIDVINKQYNDNYYRELISDIARDTGPDIFTIRNDDLPAYKEFMTPNRIFQGRFLTDYRSDFADIVVRDTMDRDSVYATASYVDNLQLYYNKNILAQEGIALPPQTWSELDRQLPRLNERDVNSLNFRQHAISLGTGGRGPDGFENINRHVDIMPMLLFQAGGQMYDYQTNQVTFGAQKDADLINNSQATDDSFATGEDERGGFTSTPSYNAIRFYADFADVTRSRYSWNTSSEYNVDSFAEGRLAYMVSFSYMQGLLEAKNPLLDYGVAPLPQLDPNFKKTYGFFFMDGLNRNLERDPSKALERQTAESFLWFLTQYEQQIDFATKTRLPGARKDVVAEQIEGDEVLRIFAQGSLFADNYYKPDVQATERLWSDMMERIQYEGMPIDESLRIAVTEYTAIVNEGPTLRN
jgi:maltose-binding protein MalE